MISNDTIKDILVFSGRVENGYYYINQSTKKLFTPFVWYVNHSQMIIGADSNEGLILTHLTSGQGAFLLIIGTSGGGKSVSRYKAKYS